MGRHGLKSQAWTRKGDTRGKCAQVVAADSPQDDRPAPTPEPAAAADPQPAVDPQPELTEDELIEPF